MDCGLHVRTDGRQSRQVDGSVFPRKLPILTPPTVYLWMRELTYGGDIPSRLITYREKNIPAMQRARQARQMATSVANITAGPSTILKPSCFALGNWASRSRLSSLQTSGIQGFSQFAARARGVPRRRRAAAGKIYAIAVTQKVLEHYSLPTWSEFEMGHTTVYWETATGEPPAAGSGLTIYFNPHGSALEARTEYGIGFNGGFNQPIMCGGEPRIMTHKTRGPACPSFYSIKINVPDHALSLEFSFTDGLNWDGPYKVEFVVPAKWRNMPPIFFNEGLAQTLSAEGACETAIYPEPAFVQDRCSFPANLTIEGGNRCELEWVPGCTDPENPFFDPLATVEDGSCPYISDSDTES